VPSRRARPAAPLPAPAALGPTLPSCAPLLRQLRMPLLAVGPSPALQPAVRRPLPFHKAGPAKRRCQEAPCSFPCPCPVLPCAPARRQAEHRTCIAKAYLLYVCAANTCFFIAILLIYRNPAVVIVKLSQTDHQIGCKKIKSLQPRFNHNDNEPAENCICILILILILILSISIICHMLVLVCFCVRRRSVGCVVVRRLYLYLCAL